MIRIIIADDHQIVRAGLRQIISEEPDLVIAGEAADGQELLEKLRRERFDVILLDISMPGRSGLEILKQIKGEKPGIPVLMLSTYPADQYAVRTMKAGAAGYINKKTLSDNLIKAIRKVHSGGKYITPEVGEIMADVVVSDTPEMPHNSLSDREFQVLCMIASGKMVSDIARELFLSVKTVSTYRAKILQKMNLKNSAELTHYVIKNNLLDQ